MERCLLHEQTATPDQICRSAPVLKRVFRGSETLTMARVNPRSGDALLLCVGSLECGTAGVATDHQCSVLVLQDWVGPKLSPNCESCLFPIQSDFEASSFSSPSGTRLRYQHILGTLLWVFKRLLMSAMEIVLPLRLLKTEEVTVTPALLSI